jgi:hypothetical protein
MRTFSRRARTRLEDGPIGLLEFIGECPIIGFGGTLPNTTAALIDRLDALLAEPDASPAAETTLTDGCARALALEAERRRILRRIAGIDSDLEQLRARIAELRLRLGSELV